MFPRILLTGFKPFADLDVNPTEELMVLISQSAEKFPDVLIRTSVFDTDYEACESQFYEALTSFEPDAILSFGVSFTTDKLKLEQSACNIDNSSLSDNRGNRRSGQRIIDEGPTKYSATIPLEEMYKALKDAEVPVRLSNHAGYYVCNHLFYYGLHLIDALRFKTLMGFIHTPLLPKQLKEGKSLSKGMDIEVLFKATRICVAVSVKHIYQLDSPF